MSDPTVSLSVKEIVLAGLVGMGGFFTWLVKRSIYGKMDDQDKRIQDLQTKTMCALMQTGCQRLLGEKMDSLDALLREKMDSLDALASGKIDSLGEKIDLVLKRQADTISRIDSHINGHSHK